MEGVLTMNAPRSLRGRRGSSFIEILVSLAILAVVMVGILQMFSLSLLTNLGSAARTDLLYKAQQVVENLRLIYYLQSTEGNTSDLRIRAGRPGDAWRPRRRRSTSRTTRGQTDLTADDPDTDLTWTYWGPARLQHRRGGEASLPALVHRRGRGAWTYWLVTVTATPVDNPNLLPGAGRPLPAVTDAANPRRFLGLGSKLKIVTYSAQIENVGRRR